MVVVDGSCDGSACKEEIELTSNSEEEARVTRLGQD